MVDSEMKNSNEISQDSHECTPRFFIAAAESWLKRLVLHVGYNHGIGVCGLANPTACLFIPNFIKDEIVFLRRHTLINAGSRTERERAHQIKAKLKEIGFTPSESLLACGVAISGQPPRCKVQDYSAAWAVYGLALQRLLEKAFGVSLGNCLKLGGIEGFVSRGIEGLVSSRKHGSDYAVLLRAGYTRILEHANAYESLTVRMVGPLRSRDHNQGAYNGLHERRREWATKRYDDANGLVDSTILYEEFCSYNPTSPAGQNTQTISSGLPNRKDGSHV